MLLFGGVYKYLYVFRWPFHRIHTQRWLADWLLVYTKRRQRVWKSCFIRHFPAKLPAHLQKHNRRDSKYKRVTNFSTNFCTVSHLSARKKMIFTKIISQTCKISKIIHTVRPWWSTCSTENYGLTEKCWAASKVCGKIHKTHKGLPDGATHCLQCCSNNNISVVVIVRMRPPSKFSNSGYATTTGVKRMLVTR